MTFLVTGGAGFIGRWVVNRLLADGEQVVVLDNLSNGSLDNLKGLSANPHLEIITGDIKDQKTLSGLFRKKNLNTILHLAADIIVQDSIDNPRKVFENDVLGTFNLLEEARKAETKFVFMSTCMVYDTASSSGAISETYPTKAASPYAGAKLAGENMVQSYYHAYDLPTVILRPFNTYGPFQKSTGEGGVVSIFIQKELNREYLSIYGDGTQTRDLMYVEDCADFVVMAAASEKCNGEIVNAGLGTDISVNDLAAMICKDKSRIRHVEHIHPQSEISRLVCDRSKAKRLLGWEPKTTLENGIRKTFEFQKARVL
ncbi:dTDP-glucose 4,6-dehydratase [Methanoregula formicica]|uniref:Nucleoside-diphosphate-sugar epimerase n=1 Tax=Methanoregula formicica (strain DSM 22288 / NBRC 105244 / SMSP) TaxID=593750 RepID=L0HEA3_METFS|nr:GDP-mannose 4,6-dehydratase [Methanoregula formicica]AGB02340.1 nucleoside-diphosphate-sugar epimerase [Methanoregula formicica SMSP]